VQYDQSVNTYSPEGRLYQVEYALKAIENSGCVREFAESARSKVCAPPLLSLSRAPRLTAPFPPRPVCSTAVGVKCKDGVILGVEKLLPFKMLVEGSGRRVQAIDLHIGCAVAGLMPDARQLVSRAREEARAYRQNFGESVPPSTLSDRLGSFLHLFTFYSYYRPLGAAVLLAGYDAEAKEAQLYMAEPTGNAMVRARGITEPAPFTASHTHDTPFPPPPPLTPTPLLPPPFAAALWRGDRQGPARRQDGD
jgi:20S proteasome subunit alpha 7